LAYDKVHLSLAQARPELTNGKNSVKFKGLQDGFPLNAYLA